MSLLNILSNLNRTANPFAQNRTNPDDELNNEILRRLSYGRGPMFQQGGAQPALPQQDGPPPVVPQQPTGTTPPFIAPQTASGLPPVVATRPRTVGQVEVRADDLPPVTPRIEADPQYAQSEGARLLDLPPVTPDGQPSVQFSTGNETRSRIADPPGYYSRVVADDRDAPIEGVKTNGRTIDPRTGARISRGSSALHMALINGLRGLAAGGLGGGLVGAIEGGIEGAVDPKAYARFERGKQTARDTRRQTEYQQATDADLERRTKLSEIFNKVSAPQREQQKVDQQRIEYELSQHQHPFDPNSPQDAALLMDAERVGFHIDTKKWGMPGANGKSIQTAEMLLDDGLDVAQIEPDPQNPGRWKFSLGPDGKPIIRRRVPGVLVNGVSANTERTVGATENQREYQSEVEQAKRREAAQAARAAAAEYRQQGDGYDGMAENLERQAADLRKQSKEPISEVDGGSPADTAMGKVSGERRTSRESPAAKQATALEAQARTLRASARAARSRAIESERRAAELGDLPRRPRSMVPSRSQMYLPSVVPPQDDADAPPLMFNNLPGADTVYEP